MSGFLAARGYRVNILSNHASLWQQELTIFDCNNKTFHGTLHKVSSQPEEVIPESDIILLAVPGYLFADTLHKIAPYLRADSCVGSVFSSSGFFFFAKSILPLGTSLFGFQRVPFISRVKEYGVSAQILGYKKCLYVGVNGFEGSGLVKELEVMLATPTALLDSYLEAALSNSNPILHPSRLYALFKDYEESSVYPEEQLFYETWDTLSSEVLIQCDSEFQQLCSHLHVHITPLLEYYESTDAVSLAKKIGSIASFKGLKAPMKAVQGGFVPDFANRYFTEDFPYGMQIVKYLASGLGIATPMIDTILQWANSHGVATDVGNDSMFQLV